jgi:hypothetical protein
MACGAADSANCTNFENHYAPAGADGVIVESEAKKQWRKGANLEVREAEQLNTPVILAD